MKKDIYKRSIVVKATSAPAWRTSVDFEAWSSLVLRHLGRIWRRFVLAIRVHDAQVARVEEIYYQVRHLNKRRKKRTKKLVPDTRKHLRDFGDRRQSGLHAIVVLRQGHVHVGIALIVVLVIVFLQGPFAPPLSIDICGYREGHNKGNGRHNTKNQFKRDKAC